MITVMASGVFDLLHTGHLKYLEASKKLGERLVVVVARDLTAERLKRKPYIPEKERLKLVSSLKIVDQAILGSRTDIYKTVEKIKPDIITLGYDQKFSIAEIKQNLRQRGLAKIKIVRLPRFASEIKASSLLAERIQHETSS